MAAAAVAREAQVGKTAVVAAARLIAVQPVAALQDKEIMVVVVMEVLHIAAVAAAVLARQELTEHPARVAKAEMDIHLI
jgi:hypothetical protein